MHIFTHDTLNWTELSLEGLCSTCLHHAHAWQPPRLENCDTDNPKGSLADPTVSLCGEGFRLPDSQSVEVKIHRMAIKSGNMCQHITNGYYNGILISHKKE